MTRKLQFATYTLSLWTDLAQKLISRNSFPVASFSIDLGEWRRIEAARGGRGGKSPAAGSNTS